MAKAMRPQRALDSAQDSAVLTDGRIALDGQVLKRLRQQLGLSQEALAEHCLQARLCVSIASIKRAELGKSVLYRTARHLATVYKVPVEELLLRHTGDARGASAPQFHDRPARAAESPVDDDEVRQVVVLYIDMAGMPPGNDVVVPQLVQQFGGLLLQPAGTPAHAVFGVPRAYLSDGARALQCAIELAQALGPQCRLLLTTQAWSSAGGAQLPAQVEAALFDLRGRAPTQTAPVLADATLVTQLSDRFLFGPAHAAWRPLLHAVRAPRSMQLPLVGRYAEVQQFKGLIEVTRSCQSGHVVYARGVAGIGKTRLMAEFADIARQNRFGVHQAAVLDFGVEAGGTALGQLVGSLLGLHGEAEPGVEERLRALGLDAEHAMPCRALMGLPQLPEQAHVYAAMSHATRMQRCVQALRLLVLREAIKQPLVAFVEDLHWGDAQLFELLGALLGETQEAPMIWVLSSRLENDPLERHIRPYCAELPLTVFGLAPLRPPEAETLALEFSHMQPDWRQRCLVRAQGNPLFLTQLLLSGNREEVPDTLKRLVQSQLDRLDPVDRRALRVASAIGQRFSLVLLREAMGLPDYGLESALQAHLVRPVAAGTYLFVHDLVMHCIYESMASSQRQAVHRTLAAAYQARDLALYAQHLDRARDARAPALLVAAIREKLAARDYGCALELARLAQRIDYAERDDYLLALLAARAAAAIGHTQQARAGFEQARDLAADAQQHAQAVIGLSRALNVLEDL